jgi:hypothetical protein
VSTKAATALISSAVSWPEKAGMAPCPLRVMDFTCFKLIVV